MCEALELSDDVLCCFTVIVNWSYLVLHINPSRLTYFSGSALSVCSMDTKRKFSLGGWNGPSKENWLICSKSRAVCVWESFEFDIHIKTQTFACWWLSLPQEAKSWLFIYHLSTFLILGCQEISTHSCASLTSEDITGLVGRSSWYYCKQTSDSYLYD